MKPPKYHAVDMDRYQQFFDMSPLPMWIYRVSDFQILEVNQTAIDHYGYSRDEFLSMTIKELRPPHHIPILLAVHKKTENEQSVIRFGVFTHKKKNGELIKMDISGKPILIEGEPCMLVNCLDVTLQESEKFQKKVIADLSVIFSDEDSLTCCIDKMLTYLVGDLEFDFAEFWRRDSVNRKLVQQARKALTDEGGHFFQYDNQFQIAERGEGLPGKVWMSGQAQYWSDLGNNNSFVRRAAALKTSIDSAIGLPLFYKKKLTGVLIFGFRGQHPEIEEFTRQVSELSEFIGSEISHKQLQEDQRQKEADLTKTLHERDQILERITEAFFALDKNWNVTYWNRKAEEFIGVDRNVLLGNNLWEIFPPAKDLKFFKEYEKAFRDQKECHFEEYYADFDQWFEAHGYPSPDGISVFFRDITAKKKIEENINKTNAKLAASNAELEQFAYVASHDLQEPLRMITSFLTKLEEKYHDQIDEKGKRYIHFAIDGAVRMRQIILDLLEFSRINRITTETEKVSVTSVVDEVVRIHKKTISDLNAVVSYTDLPEIVMYRSHMYQIIQNLLSNALKYHHENRPPKITIICKDNGKFWLFGVTDNGIGIEEEYFDKIFLIFHRLHHRSEYDGTGLGLAIVKKVVESNGGNIWVTSTPGQGSTFHFTIPKTPIFNNHI